jgi:hypothetical protein
MTCPGHHIVEFKDRPFGHMVIHSTHEQCLTCRLYAPGSHDMMPAMRDAGWGVRELLRPGALPTLF